MPTSLGFYGLNYRSRIGLHRVSGGERPDASGPLWDVYVGPIPFLLAPSDQYPYVRESAPVSKSRMDAARDPGEASLDSGVWLRGQTSWHLGAGQDYAEPLEGDADEARFRFASSGGVDPWTPGQLGMVHASLQRGVGARRCLGVSAGVLVSSTTGMLLYPDSGAATSLSSKTTITGPICVSDTMWFGASSTGIEYGNQSGGGEGAVTLAGITALSWAKDRLWAGAGKDLYEITNLSPPTLPGSPAASFRGGSVVDVDAGPSAVYVMVAGATTSIFAISSQSDGTLDAPREVATLPRGETGLCLYGYLGGYLAIGTSRGLRLADCSGDGLPIGPVVVTMAGGCVDMVGDGQYLYVTGGTERVTPNRTDYRPGLYRVDMSSPIASKAYGDSAASRFPYATDLYAPGSGSVAGRAWSVTVSAEGRIWYVGGDTSSSATVYRSDDGYSTVGWLDSGQVTFSTAERKAWVSFGVEVTGSGTMYLEGDVGSGFTAVSSTVLSVPRTDPALAVDSDSLPSSSGIRHRITLTGDGTASGSPTLQALGLRATPVPRRTRFIQLPLACWDNQVDRNSTAVGYEGFAWDRLADLEALENEGVLVTVLDRRTGESVRGTIEKVSFAATNPPSRRFTGYGGVVTLTLLSV